MTETATTRQYVNNEGNAFTRNRAKGHLNRKGHVLVAYYVPIADGFKQLIRECCGEVEA